MDEARHDGALSAIEEIFGDRVKRGPFEGGMLGDQDALALVSPANADEVELLVEIAERFSVPLAGLGAGTTGEVGAPKGAVLVHFDLMCRRRLPDAPDEFWVEVEPGELLLELDDNLSVRGQGLAVYPTSAPRATVGGWLAQDGLGVGSFEYGWLSENVLSAEVVLFGGGRRTVQGDGLRSVLGAGGSRGLVVGAILRTRHAHGDVPFGAHFDVPENLAGAVVDVAGAGVPLWHLAFVNSEMSRARGLGEGYLLFGAYPAERAEDVEGPIRSVLEARRGRALASAEAYRAWGERFFPVAPGRPMPTAERTLVGLAELAETLGDARTSRGGALLGTVARSGEVLLLNVDPHEE